MTFLIPINEFLQKPTIRHKEYVPVMPISQKMSDVTHTTYMSAKHIFSMQKCLMYISKMAGSFCSKYGFYLIMSEGIIDLHHILV